MTILQQKQAAAQGAKEASARAEALARELWKFSHLKMFGIVDDRATLRRWMARQNFPEPLVLSNNSIAWVSSEVRAWLASRPRGAAPSPPEQKRRRDCEKKPERSLRRSGRQGGIQRSTKF